MFSRISAVPNAALLEPWLSMERVGKSNSDGSCGILEKCQHESGDSKFATVEAYFGSWHSFMRGASFDCHGCPLWLNAQTLKRCLFVHIVTFGGGCVHRVAEVKEVRDLGAQGGWWSEEQVRCAGEEKFEELRSAGDVGDN